MIEHFYINKPIVSYWKSGDPCFKLNTWVTKLTDINIINTKRLTDEFVDVCLTNKNKIFLHVNITAMGQTIFEPKIPTVKETFFQLKKLFDSGFSQRQVLLLVNPIVPNENGLKALRLLLKIFTEFKELRFRFIRFNLLQYSQDKNGTFILSSSNIANRPNIKMVQQYLKKADHFWKDYTDLLKEYSTIISVDNSVEALIGIRELMAFGLKNEWFNTDGTREKIINYENGNKFKPSVNLLSPKRAVRCQNNCLLCPWYDK
jgi:DNA repair photolyase